MSKRAGTVVTMDDLVEAVGVDAARYALVRSSVDSHARHRPRPVVRRTNDNPVFYVQYAHARLASLARNAADLGVDARATDLGLLDHPREGDLIRTLGEFPAVVAPAAELREPHRVARYLEAAGQRLPQVLRRLPGAADGRRASHRRCTGPGWRCAWPPARCWPTASACSASRAPERM